MNTAKRRSGSISSYILVSLLSFIIFNVAASVCSADSYLLYKEAQFVLGSELKSSTGIFYSQSQNDVMQKPSIGLDYIYKFSDDTGDKAVLYTQARLALNEQGNTRKIEPQLYNAYIKFKNPLSDLWIGHARVPYGLSSYLDSHAQLLPPLGMYDLGFERDWGAGLARDMPWGDIAVSYTTGSGMPLYAASNHLSSARISYGVLSSDNFNVGLSKINGTSVMAMGYEVMPEALYNIDLTGIDSAVLYENYELRAETSSGSRMGEDYRSSFIRAGIKLLDEELLKIEIQQVSYTQGNETDHIGAVCVSYLYDENTALRLIYQNDELLDDIKIVGQVYHYSPW